MDTHYYTRFSGLCFSRSLFSLLHFMEVFGFTWVCYVGSLSYNSRNDSEYGNSKNNIKKFKELIAFMQKNKIKAAVMIPSIGSYQFIPHDISTNELFEFVLQHFRDEQPESMRYYYVVHDHLMDLIEKSKEDNHA